VAGDLERQQNVLIDGAAYLCEVHVNQAPVVGFASCDHHMVNRWQIAEEPLQRNRIRSVKGRRAQRAKLARGALQALGIPCGKYQLRTCSACLSGRFKSDSGASAYHDDNLPEKFELALNGRGCGCLIIPPIRLYGA
jgi:hypothetical protein